MTKKLDAVVLGATGAAGQNVVEVLGDHPWFNVACVAASSRSSGKTYRVAVEGAVLFKETPRNEIMEMKVTDVEEESGRDYDLAFSALPSNVAGVAEPRFAKHIPVFSTASTYRYEPDVPILIPDVNPEHAGLLRTQREKRGWEGFICPGPNCTTVGLVTSLKPIMERFGVRSVHMVSEQSLSGAGEKGLRADSDYRRSVEMNVLPYIDGEEEKVVKETNKILGKLIDGGVREAGIAVGATCTRVYVDRVHFESVCVDTTKTCSVEAAKEALNSYVGEPQRLSLPSAPEKPIVVLDEENMPQPKLHAKYGGQVTLIGRLRKDPVFENGLSYVLTSDNLDKGAGGGVVISAEYLKKKRYF